MFFYIHIYRPVDPFESKGIDVRANSDIYAPIFAFPTRYATLAPSSKIFPLSLFSFFFVCFFFYRNSDKKSRFG